MRKSVAFHSAIFVVIVLLAVFAPEGSTARMGIIDVLIFALLAVSFDIVFGYAGMLSLAQALFFGVAAYVTAYGVAYWDVPLVLACLIALFAAGVVGLLVGVIAVRVSGHAFLIITLIFVSVAFAWAQASRGVTGGDDGLVLPTGAFSILGVDLGIANAYYVVLAIFSITLAATVALIHSPFGVLMRAVKTNERRVEFLGFNARNIKLVAFTWASLVAGAGGVGYTIAFKHVNSELLHWSLSADALIWAFFGGLGTLIGPIIGATVLIALEDAMSELMGYPKLVTGFLLIVMALVNRDGLAGLCSMAANKGLAGLKERRGKKGTVRERSSS